MSREALVLLVCCCDFRDGAEWLIPSKSLRNAVIRAFPGLFCILRMCAPRRAAAVVRPRGREKSADRRRRILISRLLIIRASVPRRKSPFPAYFKGFPAVSLLIPPYPAFLKYPVSPHQYFTPRALIQAMVACIRPEPMKTIADPCCGSGGFFLAAQAFLADPENYTLDREQKEFLKNGTFYGNELVASTFKLCLMNLYLHNIGDIYGSVPVAHGDSLLTDPGYRVDYVLTNPPFGKRSSLTFTNEEGEQEEEDLVYNRQDFWTTSSNKQLNFVQHINTILKATGKAAVVVPDNVLFEGGAGEIVRKKLLATCDLHTILRLPTGIFYKPGVKANVIFFDKRPASAETQTKAVWIYDFRTNVHFTLKQHPMQYPDLLDFIACYHPEKRYERTETWSEDDPDGRWRKFDIVDILARDKTSLDIFWIKDKSLADLDNLPSPDVLADDIIENLQSALESFQELKAQLK